MDTPCQCTNPKCKWKKYYEGLRGSWSNYTKTPQNMPPFCSCEPNPFEQARQIKGVFGVAWVGQNTDEVNYDLEYIENPEAVTAKINKIVECVKNRKPVVNNGNQNCVCCRCTPQYQPQTQPQPVVYNNQQNEICTKCNVPKKNCYKSCTNDSTIEIQEIGDMNREVPEEIEDVTKELSTLTSKRRSLSEFSPCVKNCRGKCNSRRDEINGKGSDRTFVITKKPNCLNNNYLQQYYAFFRRKNKYRKLIGLLIIVGFLAIAYYINYSLNRKRSCKFRLY